QGGPEAAASAGELPEAQGLPLAYGGGVGVCLPRWRENQPLLRLIGGVAAALRLVSAQRWGTGLAGGAEEAKRLRAGRHARQCLDLVQGEPWALPGRPRRR